MEPAEPAEPTDPTEPAASEAPRSGAKLDAGALRELLDCEEDLDALERALLAAAIQPDGLAGDQAWLARWDERRSWLEGWRLVAGGSQPPALANAIARARRAPPAEPAAAERLRAWVAPADSLEGSL